MDPETNQQNTNQTNPGFVTKPLNSPLTPAMQGAVKSSSPQTQVGGGFMGFYRANKVYFWAIFAGLLIIAVLAYFAFRKVPVAPTVEAKIFINVDVPQAVPSGSETVYKITVSNDDVQKLVDLQLELTYPEGIKYISSSPNPANLSGTLFDVPDLIAGQNAAVFVKTKVSGNVSDQKVLNIKLRYKYANFSSEFIKQHNSSITLAASNLVLELEGPSTANSSQLIVYNLKYQNSSTDEIKNARIKVSYPSGFMFASAEPKPSLGNDTWDLGTVARNANGSISIQGTFGLGSTGESKIAEAQFLILGTNGEYFTQNAASYTTVISSLPLEVVQEVTSQNHNGVVDPGDELTFEIRYQNNAKTVANGVNIVVTLDSKAVDYSSIKAQGAQVNNNTITWNAASAGQLESLAPNESGRVSFNLKISNPAVKDSSKNLTLVSNIKIISNEYSSHLPGNQINLKISSPATLARELSHVSGELPPEVGRSTTYKVKFTLTNSSNDLNDGVLTAYIPLGAGGFVNSSVTSAEKNNVQYDQSTGKLTWNFGTLAAYAGRFVAAKTLEFEVTLNPSPSQANTSPTLVKEISAMAKDSFTSADVTLTTQDITTGSLPGQGGYTNGTVQP